MATTTVFENFTNSTPAEDPTDLSYIEIPYLLIVILVGTIGNIFIIGATLIENQILKAGGAFIINLAVADLIVTAWYVPVTLANVINEYQDIFAQTKWLCDVSGLLVSWCCQASMLTLMFIAFNRYWIITRMNVRTIIFKKKFMAFYIIFIWVESFLICLPMIFGWFGEPDRPLPKLFIYDESLVGCLWDDEAAPEFNVFVMVVAVFIPMTMTAFFYISLFLHFTKRRGSFSQPRKSMRSIAFKKDSIAIHECSSGTEVPILNTRRILTQRARRSKSSVSAMKASAIRRADDTKRNLMLTLVVVVVFFAICWTPYGVITLIPIPTSPQVKRAFAWLALSNSAINSIIYGVLNRHFRRGYSKLLKKILLLLSYRSDERMKESLVCLDFK